MSTSQAALSLLMKLGNCSQGKWAGLLLSAFSALSPNGIASVCVCVCVCVCVYNSFLIISKNSENTEKCKECHQLGISMVDMIAHILHDFLC